MKIAIDASRLATTVQPTGVEVYTRQIIQGLLGQSLDIFLYTPRLLPDFKTSRQKVLSWPFRKLWTQLRLGLELLFNPPAVFFSPSYVIPFLAFLNKRTRKVVTVHDVAFIHLPQSYAFFESWWLNLTTRQAVKYAYRIIVPTQSTKNDLIKYFNCPAAKIKVTYFSFTPSFVSEKIIDPPSAARLGQNLPHQPAEHSRRKQILFIGRIETKKNIGHLVEAFKIFNQRHPDYRLILAGPPGQGYSKYEKQFFPASQIDLLGYVSHELKIELLNQSACLVLVSNYEGFGFPLLEAFNHHLPVLASAIPALREIGGSACLFVDPASPQVIAYGLEKITQDQALRNRLIKRGWERLKKFDWQTCSIQTYKILSH